MRSDYIHLIKDAIQFAKEQRSLPFSECFSIALTDKKPLRPTPPLKPTPPKETLAPIKKEEPLKPKSISYKSEPVQIEVLEDHFEDVKKTIQAVKLDITHLEEIPDDTQANAMAQNWKYQSQISPILILFHTSSENEKMFLKNLANALSVCFLQTNALDASSIEKEDKWDFILDPKTVSFIIAPDDQIWDLPKLMCTYKETPSQSTVTLKEIPLFLIPNLKMYFQNPSLKGSLWKALCQKISPLHQSLSTEN